MKMKMLGAALAGILTAGFALPALALPEPTQYGNARYISGGIGQDEQQALKAEARDYDLHITAADPTGHFMTNTDLDITSKDGREMIRVNNAGPMFYAELPPGRYIIDATNGGQHRVQDVTIAPDKSKDIDLVWRDD